MSADPQLSVILATRNRRAVVLDTLEQVRRCGLPRDRFELIVVDNASSDGTADALQAQPDVGTIALPVNLGSCAKAVGVRQARGELLLFLDDDSYPRPGAVARMLAHFEAHPRLGAAGFLVHLPDGRQECCALPGVFVGCGVGLRAEALRQAGGLDSSFFMQAEEYDLAFRLVEAGWDCRVLGDLAVDHLKTPQARVSERTAYYDVRNNLRVAARHLPAPYLDVYAEDWLQRYAWLAERDGHEAAVARAATRAFAQFESERAAFADRRLRARALELFFRWDYVAHRMQELVRTGARSVVLHDYGKNLFAFYRAAQRSRLHIEAIADDRLADGRRHYRGVPLVTPAEALRLPADALVVSNTSFVHARQRAAELRGQTDRPVLNWFPPPPAGDLCVAGQPRLDSPFAD